MIKWFCDICTLEIKAPEHPVCVRAYRCGKNRDNADVGWGHDTDIVAVFCHKACADVLETEIKSALNTAQRMARNNA
jgi:hypothetical protein